LTVDTGVNINERLAIERVSQ